MAISEVKQNLIRKRLKQGRSLAEIAEEAGVSQSTVQRVKKKTPEAVYKGESDSGDSAIKMDNSTLLTKKEEAFAKKLKGALALYEDDVEGWTYHMVKEDYRTKQSGLWWRFVAYPESVPEDWIDRFKARGFEVAISPLHDKDKWNHDSPEMVDAETGEIIEKGARYKKGEAKKAHWHGILKSEKKLSFQEVNNIVRSITNGPYVMKCDSLRKSYEYFTHLNDPDKFQGYDPSEIILINGFHLEPTKWEQGMMQCEIVNTIFDRKMTEMWQLMEHYRDQTEYTALITAKPGVFTALLHSLWNKKNPEGKIKRVKIVEEEN